MADVRRSESGVAPGGAGWQMSRRAGLVQKATADWKNALVDLGGRNNLLHYRDLKVGTLDLTRANPEVVRGRCWARRSGSRHRSAIPGRLTRY